MTICIHDSFNFEFSFKFNLFRLIWAVYVAGIREIKMYAEFVW
jgi:hypothetical protein